MSEPTVRIASFNDLVSQLNQDHVPHAANPDGQVLEVPVKLGVLESSLFVRWEKQVPFIQVICPFILQVPPDRQGAVVDAINRVNHAIALPGFALDPDKGFVYFRLTVQRDDDGSVSVDMLRRMMRAAANNAKEFLVALRAVSHEAASPEGVIAAAMAANQIGGETAKSSS